MTSKDPASGPRRISHHHRKRSVTTWLIPLAVVVAIMIFLPKVIALLEG